MDEVPTADLAGAGAAKFLVAVWPGGTASAPLPDHGRVTIGRGSDATLCIPHESVSRWHATVHVGVTLAVEDAKSRNGTRVSGRALNPGELRSFGTDAVLEVGVAVVLLRADPALGAAPAAASEEDDNESEAALGPAVGAKRDDAMERLQRLVRLVSPSDISVVLQGETGVGKEVFAETIHCSSPRASKPFVAINCASISDTLLESELFGHEKGAFTGAVQKKMGLLESAQGGTVFLDEIGELPLPMQAKLLRALEKHEITPVGSVTTRKFDARFIAATHRDLKARAEEGAFREDLYFRLNGITLTIPPLRERTGEIPSLVTTFLRDSAERAGRAGPAMAPEALRKLEAYRWPGNIRELRNVVYRALVVCESAVIGGDDIDLPAAAPVAIVSEEPAGRSAIPPALASQPNLLDESSRDLEKQSIIHALEQAHGNQSKAALLLGITRRALAYRLQLYGIRADRKRAPPR